MPAATTLAERFAAARAGDAMELDQSKVRLVIEAVMLLYFLAVYLPDGMLDAGELRVFAALAVIVLVAFADLAWILWRPGVNNLRRYLKITSDMTSITVLLYLAGESGAPLYVIYPWVIIGNGFRYGRWFMHYAQLVAMAGFAAVIAVSAVWRQQPAVTAALILVLIAVPWYTARLLAHLHNTTRRLQQAQREAEAANIAKSKFLAAASHDLRQPMQALSMYASVLGEDRPHADSRRIMQGIQLSVQTLESMFDGLLDIARLESGVVQAKPAVFALQPMLERIAELERPLAAHKGLELRLVRTSAAVCSDPALLERMLKNLVTNAIRYTERGGIVLGCRRIGESRLRIDVADSGTGIPAQEQQRIFDEYYQLAGASAQGLGLGLPIVKSLAELLGHRVTLKSAPGRGSIFSIELDRAEAAQAPAAPASSARSELAGLCVALVDDDAEIRRSVGVLLESWGCRCIAGASADEVQRALDAETRRPGALIVDYRLTGSMDGLQVIERLRAGFGAALPALVITGTPGAPGLAQRLPGITLASKPVPPGKLRAFLSTAK